MIKIILIFYCELVIVTIYKEAEMKNKNVMFFDLFFTLITPSYLDNYNENDVLGLSINEWEQFAENDELYTRRATGQVLNGEQIIDEIVSHMQIQISDNQKKELLRLRQKRIRNSMLHVDHQILSTLMKLKEKGIKLCLISNADIIDTMHWSSSPLSKLFDAAVFSHEAKCLKPKSDIYHLAMTKMNATPEESCYIGDGGSKELYGAKQVGMCTVFTEYLVKKSEEERHEILKHTDFHITDFSELIG